MQQDISII